LTILIITGLTHEAKAPYALPLQPLRLPGSMKKKRHWGQTGLIGVTLVSLGIMNGGPGKKKQVFGDLLNEEVLRGMNLEEPVYYIVTDLKKLNPLLGELCNW
jgi:hypothetical protein